jgi:hypothetical protein
MRLLLSILAIWLLVSIVFALAAGRWMRGVERAAGAAVRRRTAEAGRRAVPGRRDAEPEMGEQRRYGT